MVGASRRQNNNNNNNNSSNSNNIRLLVMDPDGPLIGRGYVVPAEDMAIEQQAPGYTGYTSRLQVS